MSYVLDPTSFVVTTIKR